MIYNFDTDCKNTATAALIVYAIYRSRDPRRFKVSPDMWSQIDRFIKASAKRAINLPRFIDSLCPRLSTGAIHPKWMEVAVTGRLIQHGGEFLSFKQDDKRQFMTSVIADCNEKKTIDILYKETTWVVMLVRDRLEQEKPIENTFKIDNCEE